MKNQLIIQQQLPLIAYTINQLLKDPNSFLAKEEKNKQDFIINREAKILHQLLCEEYYLLDLEKQREKAVEEYELYAIYLAAQQKQLENNQLQPNIGESSADTQPFSQETAEKIGLLMDALLSNIAKLNQLQIAQQNLITQINQQPAQPVALQAYRQARTAHIKNLLSATYVLPNGQSIQLDENSEEAQEILNRAKNSLLPDQIFNESPELNIIHHDMIAQETAHQIAKGRSQEDSVLVAREIVDTRVNRAHDVKNYICDDVAAANLLQSKAHTCKVDLSLGAALDIIKLQNILGTGLDTSSYTKQYRQEKIIFRRQQVAVQYYNEQVAAQQAQITQIKQELAHVFGDNILSAYIQFKETKSDKIYENSHTRLGFFTSYFQEQGFEVDEAALKNLFRK